MPYTSQTIASALVRRVLHALEQIGEVGGGAQNAAAMFALAGARHLEEAEYALLAFDVQRAVTALEKQLGRIARKAAVRFVEGNARRLNVGPRNLEDYLGMPLFRPERPSRPSHPLSH